MAPACVIDAAGDERPLDGGIPVDPGDALVVATSGASGTPKGVILTHDAVAASARATNSRLGVTSDDHWLACLPLSHVGGLSVVTRALAAGTGLTVQPGFDPAAVEAAGATLVSLVATALQRIDPARFRTIVLGGSAPPRDLPANVVTTYGMTETGSGVVYDGCPLDGVDVRTEVDGEIHLRGPMLLRAYRDGTVPLRDGWFATGDLGRWDADGRLVVDGRRRDLIISGGENVWPEPVEAVLLRHPNVADVAVAGEPDPEWGQAVTAYVVAAGEPPTLDELRDTVKQELAPHCAPRHLVLVAAIPRTSLGKIRRGELI
jgi:o-succinylbenzoate---CoA ligase